MFFCKNKKVSENFPALCKNQKRVQFFKAVVYNFMAAIYTGCFLPVLHYPEAC
jgi:hypothetical protein